MAVYTIQGQLQQDTGHPIYSEATMLTSASGLLKCFELVLGSHR